MCIIVQGHIFFRLHFINPILSRSLKLQSNSILHIVISYKGGKKFHRNDGILTLCPLVTNNNVLLIAKIYYKKQIIINKFETKAFVTHLICKY